MVYPTDLCNVVGCSNTLLREGRSEVGISVDEDTVSLGVCEDLRVGKKKTFFINRFVVLIQYSFS